MVFLAQNGYNNSIYEMYVYFFPNTSLTVRANLILKYIPPQGWIRPNSLMGKKKRSNRIALFACSLIPLPIKLNTFHFSLIRHYLATPKPHKHLQTRQTYMHVDTANQPYNIHRSESIRSARLFECSRTNKKKIQDSYTNTRNLKGTLQRVVYRLLCVSEKRIYLQYRESFFAIARKPHP